MCEIHRKISLGFAHEDFDPGLHICQIINNDDERINAIIRYVSSGLMSDENVACFSDNVSDSNLEAGLASCPIPYGEARSRGMFTTSGTNAAYFQNGRFDPDRMLGLLAAFQKEALASGRSGARVIGEMIPDVLEIPGGSRLLEYESRVTLLLRENLMTAVCQYDARLFDGSTIMDVLKVHPLMIVRGEIIHNPFFVSPEEYFSAV
jgi:hypothetical protein